METEELSFVITLRKWIRYSMIDRIIVLVLIIFIPHMDWRSSVLYRLLIPNACF